MKSKPKHGLRPMAVKADGQAIERPIAAMLTAGVPHLHRRCGMAEAMKPRPASRRAWSIASQSSATSVDGKGIELTGGLGHCRPAIPNRRQREIPGRNIPTISARSGRATRCNP